MIRKAATDDIPIIVGIERECFSSPWSEDSFISSFANSSNHFFIAETDGAAVGYIGVSVVVDEGYILNVAVLPRFRRQGIARELLNHVIGIYEKDLKFLTLEVRPSNSAALGLYEDFAFERAGERRDYYSNPKENAFILTKYFS